MTKEITKAIILQEMQDKFKLREFDPAKFLFDETVVPVYDIAQHIRKMDTRYGNKDITSAPAAFLLYTVPQNEKWVFSRYDVVFMAVGAYTVTGIYVRRSGTVYTIYLDMKAGQSTSYHVELPTAVTLEPGDQLYVYADSYTSTAELRLYCDFMKEEIR